jgi:hypothetical protein
MTAATFASQPKRCPQSAAGAAGERLRWPLVSQRLSGRQHPAIRRPSPAETGRTNLADALDSPQCICDDFTERIERLVGATERDSL